MSDQDNDHQISKYDRRYGALHDVSLKTKPSTIKDVELTGRAETYIVQTMRHAELGDFIFIEHMDAESGLTRLVLTPKVSNAIASQRDSLTSKRRSLSSKAVAKQRMERGELPGFLRKKKH